MLPGEENTHFYSRARVTVVIAPEFPSGHLVRHEQRGTGNRNTVVMKPPSSPP